MDLDTFLTTLYVLIDDWYKQAIAQHKAIKGGIQERMSDSEVLTVAIAGQWRKGVAWTSERSLVRYMQRHGRHWFPTMLNRSAFNRRVRRLCGVLAALQREVSCWLEEGSEAGYEIVDGLPLPVCTLANAVRQKQHWLMHTSRGHGGNHGGWFFGQRWWVSVTPSGSITGWMVADAAINERWLLEAFVSVRAGDGELHGPLPARHTPPSERATPAGLYWRCLCGWGVAQDLSGGSGLNGARWRDHWLAYYAATVIAVPPVNTSDFRLWTASDCRWLASHRQPIETAYAFLTEVFGIKQVNAHSQWGQYTRLAAKAAAYNLGLFLNRLLLRPLGALATLIC